ncbi:hypothetical protein GQ42DRAFT_162034, partial [Ramicandelaber brevisporus]
MKLVAFTVYLFLVLVVAGTQAASALSSANIGDSSSSSSEESGELIPRLRSRSRLAIYRSTTGSNQSVGSHNLSRGNPVLVKRSIKKLGQKIKKGFQNFGKTVKRGFQKAGKWIKEKAIPFVKKKVLPVVDKIAGVAQKVVKGIPGIGTALSAGIGGVRAGINAPRYADMAKQAKKLERQGRKGDAHRLRGQIAASVAANSGIPGVETAGKIAEKGLKVGQKISNVRRGRGGGRGGGKAAPVNRRGAAPKKAAARKPAGRPNVPKRAPAPKKAPARPKAAPAKRPAANGRPSAPRKAAAPKSRAAPRPKP